MCLFGQNVNFVAAAVSVGSSVIPSCVQGDVAKTGSYRISGKNFGHAVFRLRPARETVAAKAVTVFFNGKCAVRAVSFSFGRSVEKSARNPCGQVGVVIKRINFAFVGQGINVLRRVGIQRYSFGDVGVEYETVVFVTLYRVARYIQLVADENVGGDSFGKLGSLPVVIIIAVHVLHTHAYGKGYGVFCGKRYVFGKSFISYRFFPVVPRGKNGVPISFGNDSANSFRYRRADVGRINSLT